MACSLCGQEGHDKRRHNRREPYWSTAGWSPRKRQRKITTDRTRAERIALGHAARKAMLGQALTAQLAAEQLLHDVVWLRQAIDDLRTAATRRKGAYRRRDLDEAVDRVLEADGGFASTLASSPWGNPLAHPPPDAVG
jgi:CO/xanthine dehydrogenase FAD-binding subunit